MLVFYARLCKKESKLVVSSLKSDDTFRITFLNNLMKNYIQKYEILV